MKNKRLFSFITAIVVMFSICTILPMKISVPLKASASGIDNIAARADYLYNITWTAQTTVKGWRNNYTFTQGNTYHIPYGQPVSSGKYVYWGISIDNFLASAQDASGVFYTKRSVNNYNEGSYSTYYAMDCSALASYCWGLSNRTTTSSWSSLPVTSCGKCTSANVNKIQKGDALNLAGSHIVIVSDVTYDSSGNVTQVEITEQTPPETKRSYYTASSLTSKYSSYTIYRYNKRDSVTPPPNVPDPKPDLVVPTIITDKASYNVGDTVYISWTASPSGSNLSHYWLNIIAPDGTLIYGGTMNKETSYSFVVSQAGDYSITTYATPIGSLEGEGSLTDTKIINVSNPDDIGHIMSESEAAGQTIPDGNYWIYSGLDMNYFLDIPGIEKITSSGTNVQMWYEQENMPSENDVWTVTYCNNGFYQIKQRGTNMCLDVSDASIYRGSNVQLCTENLSYAQQWSIIRTQYGYKLQSRCNSFYLDILNNEITSGTNVQVWTENNEKCQKFCFIPCNSDEQPIEDGLYNIQTVCDSNYYLDASGVRGEYKNDTNIQIWEEATDQYRVKYIGNGWYKIYEESSGLAVEVNNGDEQKCFMDNQRNVQLYESNTGRGQLWRIHETSDGHYFLISKLSGCYLDLLDGKCSVGQNVSQVYYLGGNPQKWNFIKVNTKGDLNNDGELSIADAVLLQKWLLAAPNTELVNWKAADLCEDNRIDVFDMIEMRKLIINSQSAQ